MRGSWGGGAQERQKDQVGRTVEAVFREWGAQDSKALESGGSPAHCESPPSLSQVVFLVSHKTWNSCTSRSVLLACCPTPGRAGSV